MLKVVMYKVDSMQKQMGNINREIKILRKEPKRNARDQKQYNKNEKHL